MKNVVVWRYAVSETMFIVIKPLLATIFLIMISCVEIWIHQPFLSYYLFYGNFVWPVLCCYIKLSLVWYIDIPGIYRAWILHITTIDSPFRRSAWFDIALAIVPLIGFARWGSFYFHKVLLAIWCSCNLPVVFF